MTFYLKALFGKYYWNSWRKTEKGGDIEWNTKSQESLLTECMTKPIYGQDEEVRLLFAGFSGYGKTTSISNYLSIFSGCVTHVGGCYKVRGVKKIYDKFRDFEFRKSTTVDFIEVPAKISGESAYFSFWDSPGLAEVNTLEESTKDLKYHMTDSSSTDKAGTKPPVRPCSLVFVMDATKINRLSIPMEKTIIDLLEHAEEKGVAVEVLLTKCDVVDPSLRNPSNIPHIFFSPIIDDTVKQASRVFSGIPKNRIHPVVNNTTDTTLRKERTILHLLAMRSILTNAKTVLALRTSK